MGSPKKMQLFINFVMQGIWPKTGLCFWNFLSSINRLSTTLTILIATYLPKGRNRYLLPYSVFANKGTTQRFLTWSDHLLSSSKSPWNNSNCLSRSNLSSYCLTLTELNFQAQFWGLQKYWSQEKSFCRIWFLKSWSLRIILVHQKWFLRKPTEVLQIPGGYPLLRHRIQGTSSSFDLVYEQLRHEIKIIKCQIKSQKSQITFEIIQPEVPEDSCCFSFFHYQIPQCYWVWWERWANK